MSRGFSWRAPPEKPAPRQTCPWCEESVSVAALLRGHPDTRVCIATGHALRARRDDFSNLGAFVDGTSWRVAAWLPLLVRGRAPFRVLPTRAARKGNQMSKERGWYDAREVWVPWWVRVLLKSSRQDGSGEIDPAEYPWLVSFFRWGGRSEENYRALACVSRVSVGGVGAGATTRAAFERMLELFLGAKPEKRWLFSSSEEKRE